MLSNPIIKFGESYKSKVTIHKVENLEILLVKKGILNGRENIAVKISEDMNFSLKIPPNGCLVVFFFRKHA